MESVKFPITKKIIILALGAESAGIFAVHKDGSIFISENFGDLLNEDNFLKYKKAVLNYLNREKIKPDVILTDLHPLFRTTAFGSELIKKFKADHIKIQHHIAHIFSAVGDYFLLQPTTYNLQPSFFGIAMDGTGYGLDGNIWGGEIFKITNHKSQITNKCQNSKSKIKIKRNDLHVERIGSLEEQIMIGGDLAVREPARMLIAILAKITNYKLQITNKQQNTKLITQKDDIYKFVKKFYARNEFEVLYSQLKQNFNCQTTTSTGRVLDAVSVLLGFAGNKRNYKHEAVKLLEENSTIPYNIEPRINPPNPLCKRGNEIHSNHSFAKDGNIIFSPFGKGGLRGILQTTPLFEYLLKNIHKDKKRLAATAQLYIAKGLYEIIKNNLNTKYSSCAKDTANRQTPNTIFAAGGMANNKIIFEYLEKQGVYISKKIPRGDEGIAVGQVVYCLLGLGYN